MYGMNIYNHQTVAGLLASDHYGRKVMTRVSLDNDGRPVEPAIGLSVCLPGPSLHPASPQRPSHPTQITFQWTGLMPGDALIS